MRCPAFLSSCDHKAGRLARDGGEPSRFVVVRRPLLGTLGPWRAPRGPRARPRTTSRDLHFATHQDSSVTELYSELWRSQAPRAEQLLAEELAAAWGGVRRRLRRGARAVVGGRAADRRPDRAAAPRRGQPGRRRPRRRRRAAPGAEHRQHARPRTGRRRPARAHRGPRRRTRRAPRAHGDRSAAPAPLARRARAAARPAPCAGSPDEDLPRSRPRCLRSSGCWRRWRQDA